MEEEDDAFRPPPNRPRRRPRMHPLSGTELQRLLTERDASNVLMLLDREDSGFDLLLLQNMNAQKLESIVRVLQKALVSTEQIAQRQAVINVITKLLDVATAPFRDQLVAVGLHGRLRQDQRFLQAVMAIVKLALQICPSRAAMSFAAVIFTLEDAINIEHFPDKDSLQAEMDEIKDLQLRGARLPALPRGDNDDAVARRRLRHRDEHQDPTLFRDLSIIPSAADFDPAQDIEVRANKIRGGYENVDEYLDVQFRLLRADLLLPLRESVLQYFAGQERPQMKGIRVYTEVRIVRPICNDNGLCFRLSFDVTRTRRVNWSVSQRLKFGSLVCLSADNFATYQCAVVDRNEPRDLERGLVDVQFLVNDNGGAGAAVDESIALFAQARDLRFIMVESPAYFEAYKHVLRGLQNITENTFPFWRYIGECNQEVLAPRYLREQVAGARYDLRPLVDNSYVIKDDVGRQGGAGNLADNATFIPEAHVARDVDILSLDTWPNANTLSLDVSQYVALQSALTREFSIVQGPPGTGKTFLGQKIMKVLLHNRRIWAEPAAGGVAADLPGGVARRNQPSPILLVCYTNHALDQFLEGMLEFFRGNLVRVGSRSKSEALEEYNLRSLRQRARENRTVPLEIHAAKQQVRFDMKDVKATIHREAAKLEILEREIVKESFLKDFIDPNLWRQLTQRSRNQSIINTWLKITAAIQKIDAHGDPQVQTANQFNQEPDTAALRFNDVAETEVDFDEEDSDDDEDDFFEVVTADAANRFLDINDEDDLDFEEDDDLFAELREGLGHDYMDRVRAVNRRLDDVDQEAEILRRREVAFNISEYGEEEMPAGMTKEQKSRWKFVNQLKKKYKCQLLGWLQNTDKMSEEEVSQLRNVWKLRVHQRWRLYRYWVDIYCRQLRGEIRDTARTYEEKARRYQEILHQEDKAILEKATVIGMTTTGAARYQAVLREIGPRVVVVEEAAEVLEGHVLTAISEHCQHVVLIGDHKQLRPNPAVHRLKTECALDISLFERLVHNNFRYDQLRYQHRMRTDISDLLRIQDLYPGLQDHESVKAHPDVRNVTSNVCFIQHYELDQQEEDTSTFSNIYEARFIVGLCEYLLLQGYSPRQMTVLSPYKGQIQLIKTQLKYMARSKAVAERMEKGGLKISSVDNYQGEENDIILLSLVRSNVDNDIGFLKANNRLCVALSRAKHGLYVVGNLEGIAQKNDMMRDILRVAARKGFYKKYLSLSCPRHRGSETKIFKPDDFKNVDSGGCKRPCQVRLNCGHACKRMCHADDPDHTDAACREPCGHLCQVCGQNCKGGHPCGKHDVCTNLVKKTIPMCGHEQEVPCHLRENQFECQHRCEETLPCGHACQQTCGSRHDHVISACLVPVEVRLYG
ncbi:NFX1-type zinc finger-containing protein 1 [Elysia marginata]|uniref:NFX1-type zinc finger-containing protein 1 n=1 Tax=Elysia marginata TaxID=1093978 RepID=A0AAV4GDP8_9GAST|nr:NFX1-type zinc finger-containing protein 1 [Elysia marginata]